MAEYTNEFGDVYSEDEINQFAQEQETTFEDIVERNSLGIAEDIVDQEELPKKPKKKLAAKPKTVTPQKQQPISGFGKIPENPLGAANVPTIVGAVKPKPKAKPVEQPSLWDDAVGLAKSLFPDSEEDNNGKLTYFEQTPIKVQQQAFNQDSKDAMNATGKFEFLGDYKPEDRALFVSKLLPKTNYTEKKYNQETDSYDVVPKQEAIDYVKSDINPKDFKTQGQLDQAIALNVKKLASQDKAFEFEQNFAKAKAAPLIKQKAAEIQKKYKLDNPAEVEKATKELQNYAAKTTTDFLVNSQGFQSLNKQFSEIENGAKQDLTKSFGRGKDTFLSAMDFTKNVAEASKAIGGPVGEVIGRGLELGAKNLESGIKGVQYIGQSVKQSIVSANHNSISNLNSVYSNIKDKPDNAPIDKAFAYEWEGSNFGTFNPKEQDTPKTYGEAKDRLKKYLDKTNSLINDRVKSIEESKKYIGLFNQADLKDGIQLDDIFQLVGEQVPNMALTAAGAVTANPAIIGLSAANMFTQAYGNQYYSAIETGLREDLGREPNEEEIAKAIGEGKYADRGEAAAWSALSAAAEFAGELNVIKNTGKALGIGNDAKTVLGSLFRGEIKNFGKSAVSNAKAITSSALGEDLTERFQTAVDQISMGTQVSDDAKKYINLKEINEAGEAARVVGFVIPFGAAVKTQSAIELKAAAVKVATSFDLSNKDINNLVQVDNFFKAASNNINERFKVGDITEAQKQSELETLGTIRSAGTKIPSAFSEDAKKQSLDLILEKANIEKEIEGKDKDLVAPEVSRLKDISAELAVISIGEKVNIPKDILSTIEIDIERTKVALEKLGLSEDIEFPELNTSEEVISYLNENTKNIDEDEKKRLSTSYGLFVPLKNGKQALIINKEEAEKDRVVTTGQHEFLHKLIYKAIANNKFLQKKIGTDLYNHIENYLGEDVLNNTEFKKRYDGYKNQFEKTKTEVTAKTKSLENYFTKGQISEESYNDYKSKYDEILTKAEGKYLEETLPLLSEALTSGDIKYNENFFTKLGDIIRRIFQKYGIKKISFETGKDVFNFVRDYNKSFEAGEFNKAFKGLAKEGKVSGVKPALPGEVTQDIKESQAISKVDQFKQELKDLEEEYDEGLGDMGDEEYTSKKANIQIKIKAAEKLAEKAPIKEEKIKEVEDTDEEEVKKIIRDEKESLSSTKVQDIYNEKGFDGAYDIIKLFRPITNKIVNKRRDVPGFDEDLLRDEIETSDLGILGMIKKYNADKGIPLAAYINKYLPVRAIAISRNLLETDFKKDVTEEKGLMAEETVSEEKEKPKYKNALESKVFDPEVIKTMQDKIIVQLRTLKSRIDEPISLNRTVTPLIAEIRDAVGKQLDIDVKKAMGGKKDGELVKWLLKNKRYVLENMTTTWLMGANGQGGIPQAIQKSIDGKWVNYPDWVDKKIDRETVSTDNAGRTSGAELVRRLPNVFNNISDVVYLSQVVGPDGNPIRGRKESLGKAVAEETALDIVNKDLAEGGVISDVLIANQERLGAEIKETFANEIARQAERGNIKQSEKLIRGVDVSLELLKDNLLEAKTIEDEVKVINNWVASSGRSLRTLAYTFGGKIKKYTSNEVLFKDVILKAIKAYSKFEGELVSDTAYRLGDVKNGKSIFFGDEKVPLFQDITEIKKDWVKNVKTINEQALQASDRFIDDIKKFKDSKKYNKYDFESYIEFLRQDQRSLIRKLSKAGMAVINLARGTKTELEHNHTVQQIVDKTIEFYDGKINEKEFRDFLNNGVVNLIPKDVELLMPKQPIAGENRMFAPDVILKIQEYLDKGAKLYNVEAEYGSKENFEALVKLSKSGLNSEETKQEFEDIRKIADRLNIKESAKMPKEQLSAAFNDIIQDVSGMENYKVFSDIVARRRGSKKNRLDLYVPPSAADFELLLYNFMGKGKKGEEQKKFFEDALLVPYTEGNILMDAARQAIKREYKKLLNAFPDINKKLESLTPDKDFTYDQAIRVAMWNEGGKDIPGLSERDERKLTALVNEDPELKAFKEGLTIMGRQGIGWVTPTEYWDASTIISDLHNLTEGDGRKKFLGEFIENVEALFGKFKDGRLDDPNMNKIEAVYGTNVREALEDVIYRMISGKNKSFGKDKETTRWSNWVNGSTGAIMFLNTRSAALQLIGAVNFLNFRDNNPYAAAKAFANQPQYWKDFAKIWNSDKMKERRGGLKEDVAAAEIANSAATSKNKVGAVLSYLLKIGYTPTQLADSFAIASGGAPFYRNRIDSYLKEGLSEEEAERKAWNDFSKVADETQQSGDPRDISKQQASAAGRLLLTFQNTAMQQSRIVKKAVLDLKNGRGDVKTNISKIAYYIAIQNIMFSVLQQGLFAVVFDEEDEDGEDEDKEKQKAAKTKEQKIIGLADDVLDTILRGTGFIGGITATTKNMILKYIEEKEKKQSDYAKVVLEGTNISPPIGSKLNKLYRGLNQTKYDKDLIKERGWGVMQDGRVHLGPMYSITGQVVEATTNIPMGRFVNKVENVSQAMNSQNEAWQRIMIGLGWSPFSVGVKENEADAKIKEAGKALRKEEGIKKSAETRQRKKDSIRQLPLEERMKVRKEEALKRRNKRKERIERERRLRRLGTSIK
jgi:hypothetical protein